MIANVVKDLKAVVRTLSTGAPKVSGTIYVAVRLELDGDADDGKYWDTTAGGAWVAAGSVAAWPEATYGAAGDWVYQLPAAATTSKVSTTKPARIGWRMTDNVATPASETASSGEQEILVYSNGAAESSVDVTKVSGDATAADNAEAFFDGTGYAGTNNTIPTVTTLTNKTGFELADGAITAAKIAADAITAAKVADGALTAAKFAANALDAVWSTAARALTDKAGFSLAADQSGVTIGTVNALASGAIAAASLAAAAGSKIADIVLRRSYASAKASSDGDALSFRSLLGAIAKLVNKVAVSGTDLLVKHEDDATTFGTQAITTTAGADPITGLDTA